MNPLLHIIAQPAGLQRLDAAQWDLLLRQSRQHKLTGHIAHLARIHTAEADLPVPVWDRLIAMDRYLDHLHVQVRREIRVIRRLLPLNIPLLLLKGAAYLARDLPHASGRLLSDVDLLLPADKLPHAERQLLDAGWASQRTDAYDQNYYRQWMHELPALRHPEYELELDLHHQILPPSGRLHPSMERMWRAADRLEEGLFTFAPIDMLLHSAAHLFQDADLQGGLRDLVDMDQMLRHFGADPDFWCKLTPRAMELDLIRPLCHALYCCRLLLHTPIPIDMVDHTTSPGPAAGLLRRLALSVLTPGHPEHPLPHLSAWLLYVRSHWLRMPPALLAAHLLHKASRRIRGVV